MNNFLKGFSLTTGILFAFIVISVASVCAVCFGCGLLFALTDPTTHRVYQNTVNDLNSSSRRTPATRSGPTATPAPSPTPIIYKFNGNGDDYVMFTSPGSGLAQFSIAHRGDSNFAVELHTADGDYIELLVNEIGDYNGRTTQRVGPGQYVLDITADGGWAVTVAPPQ